MQNINIGKSGIQVPFLGMGTWAIGGGAWWGDNDDSLSVKAIQTAVEQGIQWIDTAPIYGLYHSETVVGEAMKHIDRDKVVLSTKCGLEWRHENDRCCTRSWTAPPFTATFCKEHHRGCGRQPAPSRHRPSGRALHPLADARPEHLPAGRDRRSHDEAQGAGQNSCHRRVQHHRRVHPRLLQIRPSWMSFRKSTAC